MMPQWFRDVLRDLTTDKAHDLWVYFDSTPNLASEMIEFLHNTHPLLPKNMASKKDKNPGKE